MSTESVTLLDRAKSVNIDDLGRNPEQEHQFVVIPVAELNMPVMNALRYAKNLDGQSFAVNILISASNGKEIEYQWKLHNIEIPLLTLDSPNDSVLEPLREFVDGLLRRNERSIVTILLPVITGLRWWQRFLHNQTERLIERVFQNKAGVVTIRVPFSIAQPELKD